MIYLQSFVINFQYLLYLKFIWRGRGVNNIVVFYAFRENNLSFKFADLRQTSSTFDSLDNRAAENKTFCDIFLSLLKISTFSEDIKLKAWNDLFLFSLETIAEAQIKQRIERLSGEWKNVSGQKTS